MAGYIDLYLLPIPKKNVADYRRVARQFGRIMAEYGALNYREFIGDDILPKFGVSFTRSIKLQTNELLVASVVEFRSRSHRDKVQKQAFSDPRMAKMMTKKPLFDMKKMVYGGFKSFVSM